MAFDRPLEADRIDDFNLFSAFVRAPLWILGGVLGGNRSINEDDQSKIRRLDDEEIENSPPGSVETSPHRKRIVSDYDLASMDVSDSHVIAGDVCCDETSMLDRHALLGLKRTKNLSWSDESGRNLVEYDDESVRHEPSPYSAVTSTCAPKPVKSALRRSGSIRSDADGMGPLEERTRYIPKMTAAKSSLIMPTRPFGTDSAGNGMESPQLGYGFYTNLTPPTPEMYHSHAMKHPRSILGQSIPTHTAASALSAGRVHNQVFQNLQNNNVPMGWTSVPI